MTQKIYHIENNLAATISAVREEMANGWRVAFAPALAAAGDMHPIRLYGIIVLESPQDSTPPSEPSAPYEFIGLLVRGMRQTSMQFQREGREMSAAAQMAHAADYLANMRVRIMELESQLKSLTEEPD